MQKYTLPDTKEKPGDNQLPVFIHEASQQRHRRPQSDSGNKKVPAIREIGKYGDGNSRQSIDDDKNRTSNKLVLKTLSVVVPLTDAVCAVYINLCLTADNTTDNNV